MVAGVDVANWLAFEVADRIFENRHAASAMRDREAFERRYIGFEAFAKVLQQIGLRFANQIQHERLPLGNPIAHVAAEFHADADHRRLEAGLHDPTGEHARRPSAGADRENENPARHAAEHGIEGFDLLRMVSIERRRAMASRN